jgi:hypothetical protein
MSLHCTDHAPGSILPAEIALLLPIVVTEMLTWLYFQDTLDRLRDSVYEFFIHGEGKQFDIASLYHREV